MTQYGADSKPVMKGLSRAAQIYISVTVMVAAALLSTALPSWDSNQSFRFLLYFAGAVIASNMKVWLPGVTGTLSVNFIFTLVAIMDFSLPQVLAVSYAGTIAQIIMRAKKWNPLQVVFNVASTTISASCCFYVYHSAWIRSINSSMPMLLFFAAVTLYIVNTFSISGVIAVTEHKRPWQVWRENFFWTGSHYLVGAGLAAIFHLEDQYLGWEAAVLTVPVVYLVYRSYSLHLGQLEGARKHALEMGDLHWRAIEALALAIDAKDETTHNHLLRVRVYATEVSKELNLSEADTQAIQAAALLHDIGKLAVPEYIISKPGKLTPEEFEKMKIHPVVGAEILERVRFPYPVVPIVRSHHEKWNGKGYPSGLKGEEIPIGARVLAAVDCLDALASDRQYRKALPLDKAMEVVVSESGVSFDPRIVEILKRRYVELERMATSLPREEETKLSKDVKIDAGGGPAAGYAEAQAAVASMALSSSSIGATRQEFHSLLKMLENLGSCLSLDETLSLLTCRLKKMVPHDTAAVFVRDGDFLVSAFSSGEDARWFSRMSIPLGEGLTGWVVENRKPIVNGNPAVEPGYPDVEDGGSLRSAISIPLEANGHAVGALTLYSNGLNSFAEDQLGILLGLAPKLGLTLASALDHQQRAAGASTDDLTGLPNMRSLLRHLDSELRRAEKQGTPVSVLVVNIEGFQEIREEFGRPKGEALMLTVTQVLRDSCRESDFVARIGGEEFIVVLPGMQDEDVPAKVDQLRSALETAGSADWGWSGVQIKTGRASFPRDGGNSERLLANADQDLYRTSKILAAAAVR